MVSTRVVRISLGPDSKVVGYFKYNKMLDSRIYDIIFMDRTVQQIAANRIALSIYKHVDSEGFTIKILDQVQRHWKTDEEIEKSDGNVKD